VRTKLFFAERLCLLPARSVAARGQLLFGIAQKVTKKASPSPRFSLRCSQRAGRKQIARTPRSRAANGLMVFVYDRPLLRASARGEGAVRTDT
jgi:hypothetical protein